MNRKGLTIFRWTLRILSSILILFFLFMFIGETFFEPEAGNANPLTANAILQLSIFGLMLTGLGMAWKWELVGGILSLVAFGLLSVVNPNVLFKPSMLLLYPLTGLLFIILWILSRKTDVESM